MIGIFKLGIQSITLAAVFMSAGTNQLAKFQVQFLYKT
jgi:hypothetical protein